MAKKNKTKSKRSSARSVAPSADPVPSFIIPEGARREANNVHTTRRLLNALQELDAMDKFRLAAVIMWMRTEWAGKSNVLADTDVALAMIDALTERERTQALALAAESNLCAAVTA
jgi:hypothetical protein